MKLAIRNATEAYRLLNGVFCVYKPEGVSADLLRKTIIGNLCRDLNQLECRQPKGFVRIEGNTGNQGSDFVVKNEPSFADTPLVVGPRYQTEDINATWAIYPGKFTSGVCVIGVNDGVRLAKKLHNANMLRVYQITGKFGICTNTFHERGRILEKTTYDHITLHGLERQLAAMQIAHQKLMFSYIGLDPHSKEAYDLASKGPIRPASGSQPLIYNIKCIRYHKPMFTLEINCINECEQYMMSVVNDIGLALKSTAVCSSIRQVRFGHFGVELALLRKHWTLENIITNITKCLAFTKRDTIQPKTALLTPIDKSSEEELMDWKQKQNPDKNFIKFFNNIGVKS